MEKLKGTLLTICCLIAFVSCGGAEDSGFIDAGDDDGNDEISGTLLTGNPFSVYDNGEVFEWGLFIRNNYESASVAELPIPVYLAYFNAEEKAEVIAGIEIANSAVGYDIFEVVTTWSDDNRVIYKVDDIDFDSTGTGAYSDFTHVVGYTYNRNVYLDGLYDAGRIVTDFAIEIRSDHVNKWVVAHELGHAMGIQSHAMIDYDNNTTTELEDHSLMSATLEDENPALDDYYYMMEKQGEILLEYMGQ